MKTGATEFVCLGHLVSGKTVKPDPKKIERVKNLKPPTSLQQFPPQLGLFNYFARFIKNYAQLAAVLTDLCKNKYKGVSFALNAEQIAAWRKIKDALINECVLTHFDPNKEQKLMVDASAVAIGGVLTQQEENGEWKPVYFFGTKLQKHQKAYTTNGKEALAVVYACLIFQNYLRYKRFTIVTDHHALCVFKKKSFKTPRLMRWQALLGDFDFEVKYLKGEKHPADCIPRSNEWAHRPEGELPEDHYDKYLNYFNYHSHANKNDLAIYDQGLLESQTLISAASAEIYVDLITNEVRNLEDMKDNLISSLRIPQVAKDLVDELKNHQQADSRCSFIKNELSEGKQLKK